MVAVMSPLVATGQSTGSQGTAPVSSPAQSPVRFTAPPLVVTAQKEPADVQDLPLSVTAVPAAMIASAGVSMVGEAAVYAPNTYFSEFSARKLSVARFRGVGSSPANPGVTTYIDGVPQLNTNSSNTEFLDVSQVEFVRGPQSALFGRNVLGGLVNLTSVRPSLTRWTSSVRVPFGNFGARDLRASVSGPLADTLGLGLAFGRSDREGFTTNDLTGHDLDSRSATFGKAQFLWTPATTWEVRAIASGERARDGDYALNDLGALRENPFHAARDFEGRTDRDVLSATVVARRDGARLVLSTTTGVVHWKTRDLTDLDYTPLPLVTRDNAEQATQISQEIRLASAAEAPVELSERMALKWQAGIVLFTQAYEQDAVNTSAPFLISPAIGFPVDQHSPRSVLDDVGVGVYAQGTATYDAKLDVTVGARVDHERKEAQLETYFSPEIAPPLEVSATRNFSHVSPQVALAYRPRPDQMAYVSVGHGFKAGGFNPASPPGSEAYGEEQTWHVEGGMKSSWGDDRVVANAAVFTIDWENLQLNLPSPDAPGQFYIANVAAARSTGAELEVSARLHANVELFSALGYTHARFMSGSVSSGVDVSGRELPSTPNYTAMLGGQFSRPVGSATLLGRGEVVSYGAFYYDDANTAAQKAYTLTNVRVGVKGKLVSVEAWVRNLFDTRYIPVAFAYGFFAPSGFVGESGRPRTWGISAALVF